MTMIANATGSRKSVPIASTLGSQQIEDDTQGEAADDGAHRTLDSATTILLHATGFISHGRTTKAKRFADRSFAHAMILAQLGGDRSQLRRLYSCSESTSWSITLSRVRSATSRLSRVFSSRSSFISRISEVPSSIFLLPEMHGIVVDAGFPGEFGDRDAALSLTQDLGDRLEGVTFAGHGDFLIEAGLDGFKLWSRWTWKRGALHEVHQLRFPRLRLV